MTINNSATPAPVAATPEKQGAGATTPPVALTPQGDQGTPPEGKVTISTKEYADLQRNSARLTGFQKREAFNKKNSVNANIPVANLDNQDPDLVDQFNNVQGENTKLKTQLRGEQIRNKTSELLKDEKFKNLDQSIKNMIIKNPALISTAEDVEEAMLDIEEFALEQTPSTPVIDPANPVAPADPVAPIVNNENPTNVNTGNPSAIPPKDGEDVSKLRGAERSRAIIKNLMKAKSEGGGV